MRTTSRIAILFAALCSLFAASPGFPQDPMSGMNMSSPPPATEPAKDATSTKRARATKTQPAADPMSGMDMSSMQGMDMPSRDKSPGSMAGMSPPMQPAPPQPTGEIQQLDIGARIGARPVVRGLRLKSMGGDAMQGMPPMQGGSASPDARSPDYSDGNGYGSMVGMDMRDDAPYGMVLLDQFEYADGNHGNSTFIDSEAYYGTDLNKLWLKAEGERSGGKLQDLRTEALWDHAYATYFSTQFGVRHDFGEGPDRNWAVFGVQGLAPYWFELEAVAYIGENGRTAARFQAEYEEKITQRLILQPKVEINLYGRDDPQRGIGSGLSDAEFGLRLRYEIRREFAPYVGVVYRQRYARTADFARALGEPANDTQLVAGIHFWF